MSVCLPANCQEPVQKVDSQGEDLRSVLTGVITHVEHPANYQLPHVRLDLNLDECEIVRVAGKIPGISIISLWLAVKLFFRLSLPFLVSEEVL